MHIYEALAVAALLGIAQTGSLSPEPGKRGVRMRMSRHGPHQNEAQASRAMLRCRPRREGCAEPPSPPLLPPAPAGCSCSCAHQGAGARRWAHHAWLATCYCSVPSARPAGSTPGALHCYLHPKLVHILLASLPWEPPGWQHADLVDMARKQQAARVSPVEPGKRPAARPAPAAPPAFPPPSASSSGCAAPACKQGDRCRRRPGVSALPGSGARPGWVESWQGHGARRRPPGERAPGCAALWRMQGLAVQLSPFSCRPPWLPAPPAARRSPAGRTSGQCIMRPGTRRFGHASCGLRNHCSLTPVLPLGRNARQGNRPGDKKVGVGQGRGGAGHHMGVSNSAHPHPKGIACLGTCSQAAVPQRPGPPPAPLPPPLHTPTWRPALPHLPVLVLPQVHVGQHSIQLPQLAGRQRRHARGRHA